MSKLRHNDISQTKPERDQVCVWCWTSRKIKASYRVWSKEWQMYMNVCRRHARVVIQANVNTR